jgi:hypothetical protein
MIDEPDEVGRLDVLRLDVLRLEVEAVERLLLDLLFDAVELVGLLSERTQRLPFRPVLEFQANPGTNKIDSMFEPLMAAVPHSVSIVTSFTSVAPVIESPFSMTTVVVAFSAEAKRMPATSESGMFALPNDVRISRAVESIKVPDNLVDPIKSAVMLRGRTLATAFATGFLAASTFLSSAFAGATKVVVAANATAAIAPRNEKTAFIG